MGLLVSKLDVAAMGEPIAQGFFSYLWEIALAVADKKAGFTAAAVSYYNNLFRVCWSISNVGGGRLAAR